MEQELREAYEDFKNYTSGTGLIVKNLLESFLSLKGFPEEKKIKQEGCQWSAVNMTNRGYNQAIKDCKLSLLKKMDGISNVIISSAYPFLPTETETKVIKALKDHLTK